MTPDGLYFSHSEEETLALARALADTLRPGDLVALYGGMGMGKTAFVRGLAQGLGMDDRQVSSPTFALMNEYRGEKGILYHFDMYRVESEEALHSTGFFDFLEGEGILAVEWSENIRAFLPEGALSVTISPGEDDASRVVEISRSCG